MYRWLVVLSTLLSSVLWGLTPGPLSAKAAVLMNVETKSVLYQKNPHLSLAPASTTKLATALYILSEKADALDRPVDSCPAYLIKRISPKRKVENNFQDPNFWIETDGVVLGIRVGDTPILRDLLCAFLVGSGNDAANLAAHASCGDVTTFVDNLNQFVQKVGCKDTHFCNPNGLHHPKHLSTAYDLALLGSKAYAFPIVREMAMKQEFIYQARDESAIAVQQNNELVVKKGRFYYPKAVGLKTGFHKAAQFCTLAAASDGKRVLVAALLGCPSIADRAQDAIALFEAAFSENMEKRCLFRKEECFFSQKIKGASTPLQAMLGEDVFLEFYPSEEGEITATIKWLERELPIFQNQRIGILQVLHNKKQVLEIPLYAKNDLYPTRYFQFKQALNQLWEKRFWLFSKRSPGQ